MKKILILIIGLIVSSCGNDFEYRDSFVIVAEPQMEYKNISAEREYEIYCELCNSFRYFNFYIGEELDIWHRPVFCSEFALPEIFYDQYYQLDRRINKRFNREECSIKVFLRTYKADVRGIPIKREMYTAEIIF